VIGLDTNVLARYFVEEDDADGATQRQRQAARDLIESGQPCTMPATATVKRWRPLMIAALSDASANSISLHVCSFLQAPEWGSFQELCGLCPDTWLSVLECLARCQALPQWFSASDTRTTMRTVRSLIEELARFPDEALCYAYEGEISGIVIRHCGHLGVIHCGEREGAEQETEPLPPLAA